MSFSSIFSNAASGLRVITRGTEVVSSNLANVHTPGYSTRELLLSQRGFGGGVTISGVARLVSTAILADVRLAQADLGKSGKSSEFHLSMEGVIGTANDASSLGSLVTSFDSALRFAASSPSSDIRLAGVLDAANALAGKLNAIGNAVQNARAQADSDIAGHVSRLNKGLEEVARLNRQIASAQTQGQDTGALLDSRQRTIDGISDIVPLQEVARPNGQVAIFTKGGATLLDGSKPATISFQRTSVIAPDSLVENGGLGALVLNGEVLSDSQMRLFAGGGLEGAFDVRDRIAPSYQANIDSIASDLYRRMASTEADPSLNTGQPGIFTDQQDALTNSVGFANRIQVNSAIKPAEGGALWRIRDGINNPISQDTGDGSLLNRMAAALAAKDSLTLPGFSNSSHSFQSLASEMMSLAGTDRLKSAAATQNRQSYGDGLQAALLAYGVDSDQQMEKLLQLEKAYAANAQVLQAASDMLDSILRIS